MVVGVYLVTKKFEIFLDSQDKVARIKYDYTSKQATVFGVSQNEYKLKWK